jgi:valyl-tRNA synthetase
MGKEKKDLSAQIEPITKLLGSDFANKVPTNVVQKDRDKLADFQARTKKLREQIERLGWKTTTAPVARR